MVKRWQAFTLIELLIVVAIIAILAAIAVPNFLEAQVRSKVGRVKADMRSIATGLESYRVDNNDYPFDSNSDFPPTCDYTGAIEGLTPLSTPIPYLTAIPKDAFTRKTVAFWFPAGGYPEFGFGSRCWIGNSQFWHGAPETNHKWVLTSTGPDTEPGGGALLAFGMVWAVEHPASRVWGGGEGSIYDPSNGTVSPGDIARVGP